MMKAIDNKFKFSIDENDIFEMRDGSFMKWIESKQKEGTYLVRYVRPFRVQEIRNNSFLYLDITNTLHLN